MAWRILPLLQIECTATHCGDCPYLDPLATGPMCGLLTESLDSDTGGPIRAEECIDAEARAVGQ